MRILYFDCFSGIAGDMTVGALRDLGVPEPVFLDALKALGMPGTIHAHFQRGLRQGISGWKFDVHAHSNGEHAHGEHAHGEHAHGEHAHAHGRSHAQIRALLESSALAPGVKSRALAVFRRIAEAEGRIHGVPAADVGFHEVGAEDSIADIVCACAGIESLGVDRVLASHLIEGSGWVSCAHGRFPLPAPATLAILEGIPLRQTAEEMEFITPTGAALLAEYCTDFGPMPSMRVSGIGYGLGTRDTPPRPNVLRAVIGEVLGSFVADEVAVLETNLDDLTPELAAAAAERLFLQGALDVFTTAAQMKKGRPGFLLTVIAKRADADRLAEVLLEETSSFGVRQTLASRLTLDRETVSVSTRFGEVMVKVGRLGSRVLQASPEFESCRLAADGAGVPVREVYLAAVSAAEFLKSSPGGAA